MKAIFCHNVHAFGESAVVGGQEDGVSWRAFKGIPD